MRRPRSDPVTPQSAGGAGRVRRKMRWPRSSRVTPQPPGRTPH